MIALIISFVLLFLAARYFRQVHAGLVSPGSKPCFQRSDPAFRSFSTATTLTAIDHTVVFKGSDAVTATLPDATTCSGRVYSISNSSNTIPTPTLTIAPKTLQNIDGESICSLPLADQSILIISDGANWKILTEFIPSASHPREAFDRSVSYASASVNKAYRAPVFYDISVN